MTTAKEQFADEFAAALTADTMDPTVRGVVTGLLMLDPSGERLRELMQDDLATPLQIEPVVFKRTRKLLMVMHRPAAALVSGLGQFDWLTFGLTKLIDVGTQIGTGFVSNMLKEDLVKTTTAEQLRLEQERTRQAQLAAEAARAQAAGQVATAQLSQAGLIPGLPNWVLPVALGAGALFLFGGKIFGARRNPVYVVPSRTRRYGYTLKFEPVPRWVTGPGGTAGWYRTKRDADERAEDYRRAGFNPRRLRRAS